MPVQSQRPSCRTRVQLPPEFEDCFLLHSAVLPLEIVGSICIQERINFTIKKRNTINTIVGCILTEILTKGFSKPRVHCFESEEEQKSSEARTKRKKRRRKKKHLDKTKTTSDGICVAKYTGSYPTLHLKARCPVYTASNKLVYIARTPVPDDLVDWQVGLLVDLNCSRIDTHTDKHTHTYTHAYTRIHTCRHLYTHTYTRSHTNTFEKAFIAGNYRVRFWPERINGCYIPCSA